MNFYMRLLIELRDQAGGPRGEIREIGLAERGDAEFANPQTRARQTDMNVMPSFDQFYPQTGVPIGEHPYTLAFHPAAARTTGLLATSLLQN